MRLAPLHQQVIVITGASSGIGRATARLAADAGARVVLAARSGRALEEQAEAIRAAGGSAIAVIADVGSVEAVQRVAERAVEAFGGIDTWVNNAGVSAHGALDIIPLDAQRRVFETTYWGVVHGSLVALEHLRDRGGAIINVGSVLSVRAFPQQGPYVAAKHAVKGFTDALRVEVMGRREPISVTLVLPSAVDTPYARHAASWMGHEPRNPPPLYAPVNVALAILHAAAHPRRELVVGGVGRFLMALGSVAPGLLDRAMGRVGKRMQQTREPAAPHAGTLYTASGGGGERGGRAPLIRERSYYSLARRRRGWVALGLGAVAAVATAAAVARRVA